MAEIRGSNTQPELRLRSALHRSGYRFRLHDRKLPGRPDIVLPRYRVAIQVHGCFWHRHDGCRFATTPKTRTDFWEKKFTANVARDKRVQRELLELHWRVATVWECSLKKDELAQTLESLTAWIVEDEEDRDLFDL